MIKGCQKKIIMIKGNERCSYESAFFILRKGAQDSFAVGDDIVKEADRIVLESFPAINKKRHRKNVFRYLFAVVSSFIGGSIFGILSYTLIKLL